MISKEYALAPTGRLRGRHTGDAQPGERREAERPGVEASHRPENNPGSRLCGKARGAAQAQSDGEARQANAREQATVDEEDRDHLAVPTRKLRISVHVHDGPFEILAGEDLVHVLPHRVAAGDSPGARADAARSTRGTPLRGGAAGGLVDVVESRHGRGRRGGAEGDQKGSDAANPRCLRREQRGL